MKISILGAGLAGLSSAIKLSENGHNVSVYEQFSEVGKSQGNDSQAIRNYDLENDQLKIWKNSGLNIRYAKPITKIVKYAPSGKSMEVFSNNGPLFYSLKRGNSKKSLDQQLYQLAEKNDVKIEFNTKKVLNEVDIIANGGIFRNIWAYGFVYKDVKVDPKTILFFMDNKYAPQGYVYFLPYGKNEVSIAITSFDFNAPLPLLLAKFVKENQLVESIVGIGTLVNKFAGKAYFNLPNTAEIAGKKFVGGAAGFTEPARGFGVKLALDSALLVAESINNNKNYDSLWKKAFEKELFKNFKRRLVLEKMSNDDYEQLILAEKLPITKYEKIPKSIKAVILGVKADVALAEWQKKYDLKKLFIQNKS